MDIVTHGHVSIPFRHISVYLLLHYYPNTHRISGAKIRLVLKNLVSPVLFYSDQTFKMFAVGSSFLLLIRDKVKMCDRSQSLESSHILELFYLETPPKS